MNKLKQSMLFLSLCLCISLPCHGETVTANQEDETLPEQVLSLTLDKPLATIEVGETVILKPSLGYAIYLDQEVSWVSSNANTAFVNMYGIVTGKKAGIAIITASIRSGQYATCKVTVIDPPVYTNSISEENEPLEGGDVTISDVEGVAGTLVELSVTADQGYVLEMIQVTTESGEEVVITEENESYTFTQPEENTVITVIFTKEPLTPWENPFSDVKESDWFYSSVATVNQLELMNGTSDEMFSPSTTTSRAMLVTMLYSLAGKPESSGNNTFSDISSSDYYALATAWASEEKIVTGTSETEFSPNLAITREQVLTILYAYEKANSVVEDFSLDILWEFTDKENISIWAKEAVAWGTGLGLVTGRNDGSFAPKESATRGEIAVIFDRYLSK